MSIVRSLYSAVGGLGAHSQAIGVVSDNIANLNTIGFKASRGRFSDVLSSTSGDGVGQGAAMSGVDALFTQGALLATGVNTDLAVAGDGFFLVNGAFNGVDGSFFTRAGQFNIDGAGQLVTPNGLVVQGYGADAQGNIGSTVGDIQIPSGSTVPAEKTDKASIALQLDANAVSPGAFDPTNPDTTSNFSTSITVYDSLGAAHSIDVYFTKSATTGEWAWNALADPTELAAGASTTVASGTLTFGTDGSLTSQTNPTSDFDFANADPNQAIAFDFANSSGFASESTTKSISANGSAAGSMSGMEISEDGTITGSFTNGKTRVLGQIALARFQNTGGLQRIGSGLYAATASSGQASIGQANGGGRGAISSGTLEQSNVDLVQEFVNLIAYQRGFQANSRTITTADEMLAELVNIKR